MPTVFVMGGIGAGKTTTAQALASALDAAFVPEAVDENPFLPLYALDRARWAFTCQTYYFHQYVLEYDKVVHSAAAVPTWVVIDAGAPTNRHVYARYIYEMGLVSADEYAFYQTLTALINQQYTYPDPDIIVSVEAPLDISLARLHSRGRSYELEGHTPSYVETVRRYTDEMVHGYEASGVPIVRFDSSTDDARSSDATARLQQAVRAAAAQLTTGSRSSAGDAAPGRYTGHVRQAGRSG